MTYVILLSVLMASLLLTKHIKNNANKLQLVDIPNHRSSHLLPTPRGGGVAFVTCFLLVLPLLFWANYISFSLSYIVGIAGFIIAFIGFIDDRSNLSAKWRILFHFAVSLFIILSFYNLQPLVLFNWTISPGILLHTLLLGYLIWLLNLYNFMDGIDGLAGIEAISSCCGMVLIYWLSNNYQLMTLPLVLTASVAGFLYWNYPPAKIFMGDAGSGFLGIMLGIFSLQALSVDAHYFWCWLILLGVFIVDATYTLFVRFCQGLRVYEAHRSHAYQHATQYFKSHKVVTLSILVINGLFLLPIALLVGLGKIEGYWGIVIAYLPLLMIVSWFRAGMSGES